MIDNIAIKKIATFNTEGINISDLKQVNFIYGANGSGKTTVSNFLTDLSNCSDCFVKWKDDQEIDTLVYNKNFREQYFKKDSIHGVFTLGRATKDEQDEIDDKKIKLGEIQKHGLEKKGALEFQKKIKQTNEDTFINKVWNDIYKKYKSIFKEAFIGYQRKANFRDQLLSESKINTSNLLTFDELKEKSITIFGKEPQTITPFQDIDSSEIESIENNEVWQTKIIGKADIPIAQLIQTLNLNDWVNKGREYLQDETCPFCQQDTITNDFKQQLEGYFDESFTKNIADIKKYEQRYRLLTENLIDILESVEASEKNNQETEINLDMFSAQLKTLISQFNANKNLLENKIKEPSRSIELVRSKEELEGIQGLIKTANEQVTKHNNIVNNFQAEKTELISSIWKFLINENDEIIKKYNKNIGGINTSIEELKSKHTAKENEWKILDNEIKKLTKDVTSIQPTIDSINQTLENFGFLNFTIEKSLADKNKYQIQRENGELVEDTLSEGEITFITFLYFMQLAKGSIDEDAITNDRVLIVDDPVSSLDSNVLFIVSTLLKEVIEKIKNDTGDIKQIILLTHNIYFHKEVSFINGRTKSSNNTKYWILRKKNKVSEIQAYGENPISNSYELLWQELRNAEQNSNTTIQNTMRRIIEYYFKILGQYGDDQLIGKFESNEKRQICRSLLHWINDGSHGIADDLFVESPGDTQEMFFCVFENIFKKTNHHDHYKMMMR